MRKSYVFISTFLFTYFIFIYLSLQSQSIFGGDAGDLVTAAFSGGVAHPPGYPLYTFLGYVASHTLTFEPVAWRVGLLSSIPLTIAMTILFCYISLVSGSFVAGIVATLTLGTSYIYWLYAVVPEVFGLHILFVVSQLLALELWRRSHNKWLGISFVALFTLSLSHHHIILFMVPSYLYLLSKQKKDVAVFVGTNAKKLLFTILVCLLPILWFVVSITHLAAYTWEDTLSFQNILRIITRATYGSFSSANIVVEKPLSRLTGVYAYFAFLLEDITIPAALLAGVGGAYLFFKKKAQFIFTGIGFIFTGPIFFFYAGYILTNSFTIATFERFVMPSYIFVSIWLAFGIVGFTEGFNSMVRYIRRKTNSSSPLYYTPMIFALCMIIPMNLLFINYPKMAILKNDVTAENIGKNILNSADNNAILLISNDNEIFNTSYMNIAMGYRSDLIVINRSHLLDARRFKNIAFHHPDIYFPDKYSKNFSDEFILENIKTRPIYTNDPFALPKEYVWIRLGLLHKLFKKNELPPFKDILAINNVMWDSYYDPLSGSLGKYRHLMLSSNLLQYRMHSYETGEYFSVGKDYINAEKYYRAALRFDDNDVKVWQKLGDTLIMQKKCNQAKDVLNTAYEKFPKSADTPLLFIKLYTECDIDDAKVDEWKKAYDVLLRKSQKQLQ